MLGVRVPRSNKPGPRSKADKAAMAIKTIFRLQFSDGDVWDGVPHSKLDIPPPVDQFEDIAAPILKDDVLPYVEEHLYNIQCSEIFTLRNETVTH